jgi:dihydroxyacetone kinase-like protein
MPIYSHRIQALIRAAIAIIQAHSEEITTLDQAIGDGDHIVNLQRGLQALEALVSQLESSDWSAAFQKIGMCLMSSVGGASGSLYGTLFMAMGKSFRDQDMSLSSLAEAFHQGVEAVKQRGKADVGEKTMLDVLVPVASTLQDAAKQSLNLPQLLENINQVAEAGCLSTRDLIATKGRASFLGERARGYLDPGARTSQLIIKAITEIVQEAALKHE